LLNTRGDLVGAVNMLIDITHRSVAYEEAQRFTAIVQSSDDAIVAKDLDGTIVSWNGGAERLFGYTADEIIGKPVTTLISADRYDEEHHILSRIRAGETIDYETVRPQVRRPDRDLALCVCNPQPSQAYCRRAKIDRDIRERRRAEEQQHLLMQEMNHRSKNLFPLAASVMSLTERSASTAQKRALVLTSARLSLVMLVMLRHAAPLRPRLVTVMGSLSVAALTATALFLFHPLDATVMILMWNLGTAVIFVALGSIFSRRMFHWVWHAPQ
jgi:PAS domain S-box-containing protein